MAYSTQIVQTLREAIRRQRLLRPARIDRYEGGDELVFDATGVAPVWTGRVRLGVERFVGGGFAGQVYRVKVLDIAQGGDAAVGLTVGGVYAIKILVPPSRAAGMFRNAMYALGFQGAFSLQGNPSAARPAALWQKLIRRGAKVRLGDERAVADVLATFIDPTLGSCGEIVEWIDGRNWRFEVDDQLDLRHKWVWGKHVDQGRLGSPEYRAKRRFMADIVKLLHEMGAAELARQYEWWTCKSQPNCLKRRDGDCDPGAGLTAVDFRAGLALLPFGPMSPADFKLIANGVGRGSLVQFDRGELDKLGRFIDAHADEFADLTEAFEQLKVADRAYRRSLLDITHNYKQLLRDRTLRSDILDATVTGWAVRNITDEKTTQTLRSSSGLAVLFVFVGMIPFLAARVRRIWGRGDWRRHLAAAMGSRSYLGRAIRAAIAESLIRWYRTRRVGGRRALRLLDHPWWWVLHIPLSILPVRLHRLLTDRRYAIQVANRVFVRPVTSYFNAEVRRQWLAEMIAQGREDGMLSDAEADRIESRIDEPFIQKYLKSLAVHVCTLPVTQIVSVIVAIVYVRMHPELSWAEGWVAGGVILGIFQVIPISPGSIARGLYVVYLVIRERNFKDYNIAVFLSFFKYVGYLAFPIQMAYRYPALARFMAGRWATGAAHLVPVFGERGALLEHGMFDLFYNWPLTLRRRMRQRYEAIKHLPRRVWHVPACAGVGVAVLVGLDMLYVAAGEVPPALRQIWYLAFWVPLVAAYVAARWAGGARASRRIVMGVLCGVGIGLGYALIHIPLKSFWAGGGAEIPGAAGFLWELLIGSLKRVFYFALAGVIGAALEELSASAPSES